MDDILESYRILDIGPNASLEEVKRAYRELTRVWHPDRFPNDIRLQQKAEEKLKQINLAYERICGRGTYEPRRPTTSRTRPTSQNAQQSSPPPRPSPQPVSAKPKSPTGQPRYAWMLYLGFAIIAVLFVLHYLPTAPATQRPQTEPEQRPQETSPDDTFKPHELTSEERRDYDQMIESCPPPRESGEYRPWETLDENIRRANLGTKRDCLIEMKTSIIHISPQAAWKECSEREQEAEKNRAELMKGPRR